MATARKSRFNTLPPEIDSALGALYVELEKVPLLQRRVKDLEEELRRLQQVVQMQKNEVLVAGRRNQKLSSELEKVRGETASRQADVQEKRELQARNQQLESELADSRRALETTNKTFLDWKQNLMTFVSDKN